MYMYNCGSGFILKWTRIRRVQLVFWRCMFITVDREPWEITLINNMGDAPNNLMHGQEEFFMDSHQQQAWISVKKLRQNLQEHSRTCENFPVLFWFGELQPFCCLTLNFELGFVSTDSCYEKRCQSTKVYKRTRQCFLRYYAGIMWMVCRLHEAEGVSVW